MAGNQGVSVDSSIEVPSFWRRGQDCWELHLGEEPKLAPGDEVGLFMREPIAGDPWWRSGTPPEERREQHAAIRELVALSSDNELQSYSWLNRGVPDMSGARVVEASCFSITENRTPAGGFWWIDTNRIGAALMSKYRTVNALLRAKPAWAKVLEEYALGQWDSNDNVFIYWGTVGKLDTIYRELFRGNGKKAFISKYFRTPEGNLFNYESIKNNPVDIEPGLKMKLNAIRDGAHNHLAR